MSPYQQLADLGTALSALAVAVPGEGVTEDALRAARLALTRLLVDCVERVVA